MASLRVRLCFSSYEDTRCRTAPQASVTSPELWLPLPRPYFQIGFHPEVLHGCELGYSSTRGEEELSSAVPAPPLCPVVGSTQHQDGASAPCMPSLPPSHPTPLGLPRTGAGPPHLYSFSCPESLGPLCVWLGGRGCGMGGVWNRGSGFRLRELSARQPMKQT